MSVLDLQANTVHVASPSELDRIRFPDQLFTDAYLNNPIEFNPDMRFDPKSVVQQIQELTNQIERDFSNFGQIDKNANVPQLLTVNLYSDVIDPVNYMKFIGPRAQFTEF